DAAGTWDESLSMNDDGEYMARVLARSDGIVFCERAQVLYRSGNPFSYGSRKTVTADESDLRAWDALTATMVRLENSDLVWCAAATGFQRLQARYFGQFPELVAEAERKGQCFGKGAYHVGGGPLFQATARLFGWRNAMRLRRAKARAVRRT